jgi:hypothetical protein
MDNVQKHNICISVPSSQILDLKGELFIKLGYKRNMQLDYKFVVTC